MDDFEQRYKQIADTKLWELFARKAKETGLGKEFTLAVGEVCAIGLNLSKTIIRFFPTFTLHDDTHSANVCRWITNLLGDRAEELTAHEAALLLMAACCHDIGMSVSEEQKARMCKRTYSGWDDYFKQNLGDALEYDETGIISDRMLRKFVRLRHHERIGENLRQSDWPRTLNMKGITRDTLLKLCRSHGMSLSRSELRYEEGKYDLLLCAVLLRLADLLDYDTSRAPEVLFRHMGLGQPQDSETECSAQEYEKNQAGSFDDEITNGTIRYYAEYKDPQQEQDVQGYLDWVERELKYCADNLAQTASDWKSLRLPYKISTEGVTRLGYASGKFCMTMDQDKVIELLAGKNLYSDPGVFVRELLQNAIDAVLMRAKQDPDFTSDQGRIMIDTWSGDAGDTWFRIRDNGTGMDEHIITNYFLNVGNSYYTSDEFRYANRHAPGGSYTAISRFGIGILSCFMCDPKYTELKVSTKRFRPNTQNGIRLDVTGLHGYYYLSHEAQHPVYENSFIEMPSPNGEDHGYREEPGTTICVRTNLFRLGSVQSFREILDRYIQFPEVRVEYNGPEGHKDYPTQQELMDAVHVLNPDGVVKEYVHEIPDEAFERIKKAVPKGIAIDRPSIVLCYKPLDLLADSEKLTGLSMSFEVRGESGKLLIWPMVLNHKTLRLDVELLYEQCYNRLCSCDISMEGEHSVLSSQEQKLWNFCWNCLPPTEDTCVTIAYNGVFVTSDNWYTKNIYEMRSNRAILLLREDFLPQVNLARDKIDSLSLEAACCLEKIPGLWDDPPTFMNDDSLRMATERELWEILDRHPQWKSTTEECMRLRWLSIFPDRVKIPELLQVAAWKRRNSVVLNCMQDDFYEWVLVKTENLSDELTADFPAMMFVGMDVDRLYVYLGSIIMYNRSHRFSRWLIEKRSALAEQVPSMYDTLIRTMMLSSETSQIPQKINTILKYLRSYEHNRFGIHDDLFLTGEDA